LVHSSATGRRATGMGPRGAGTGRSILMGPSFSTPTSLPAPTFEAILEDSPSPSTNPSQSMLANPSHGEGRQVVPSRQERPWALGLRRRCPHFSHVPATRPPRPPSPMIACGGHTRVRWARCATAMAGCQPVARLASEPSACAGADDTVQRPHVSMWGPTAGGSSRSSTRRRTKAVAVVILSIFLISYKLPSWTCGGPKYM
jgi:hypothetical protein